MKGWKGVGVLVLVLVGSCCRCGLDVEVLDVEVLDVEGLEGGWRASTRAGRLRR